MIKRILAAMVALLATAAVIAQNTTSNARPRASDLGLKLGIVPSGLLDAITDVAGVEVGHTTIIRGDDVRTGVTPSCHIPEIFSAKRCPARSSSVTPSAS